MTGWPSSSDSSGSTTTPRSTCWPRRVRRGARELAQFADATLFGRADSWYMGANIPGKPRQLLNYPSSGTYIQRLRSCAAHGYSGFVFDT